MSKKQLAAVEHYEKHWEQEEEGFEAYGRNVALVGMFKAGERVLDVGCGSGDVAAYLKQKLNIEVTGVDLSKEAVHQACQKGIEAKVIDVEGKLPFKESSFDAVFWGDNIEHLLDPLKTAKEIRRVLKRNGRLVLSCPNMGYWRYRIYYAVKGMVPTTEWTGLPSWNWAHIRFFNNHVLEKFLKEVGFGKITRLVGISSRRLDRPLLHFFPAFFGMVMLAEVENK